MVVYILVAYFYSFILEGRIRLYDPKPEKTTCTRRSNSLNKNALPEANNLARTHMVTVTPNCLVKEKK